MKTEIEIPFTPARQNSSAVDLLSELSGLSRSKVKNAMTKGAVWLEQNGSQKRLRRAKRKLEASDKVALFYSEKILDVEPAQPVMVADQSDFSIWHKPSGLMSSGSRFGDHCAIDRVIERQLDRPTFLVHRLDRYARGLMVLAHNRHTAAALARQFEHRSVEKVYQAIVNGILDSALDLESPVDGKPAISHVSPLKSSYDKTLVEVRIETGRKHQIRVHLSNAGYAIVGDRQYAVDQSGDMQLAAVRLAFEHPGTRERVSYELPVEDRPSL